MRLSDFEFKKKLRIAASNAGHFETSKICAEIKIVRLFNNHEVMLHKTLPTPLPIQLLVIRNST